MTEGTFTVIALLKHTQTSRATVSTVKLAKNRGDAQGELQRMLDVTIATLGPGNTPWTTDRGDNWAHISFKGGISYHFSIQRASWVKKKEAAKV